jgi:hypothetical protein
MGQILALSGIYMIYQVLTACFFQRIALLNPLNGEPIEGSERGYGFLSREADFGTQPDYQQCIYYPDDEYAELFADGWMPAAKHFVMMSGVLGCIGAVVLISACCFAWTSIMFERWLLWGYLLAAAFVALSMLIFGSQFCADNKCEIGQTGGVAISSFLFWCVMANTVKSMGEVLPPKRSRREKNRAAQDDDDDYGFDDATAGDDDDETGRDMYFETPEAMYVKRRPPPQQEFLPSEDSDDDDDANDPYDDDDDDDEGWRDEDSDDEPPPGFSDDPDYDNTPKVGDLNGPVMG